MKTWEYKGIMIFPADRNAYGIRWTANSHKGLTLRSDTKQGMKDLINDLK